MCYQKNILNVVHSYLSKVKDYQGFIKLYHSLQAVPPTA
jgi:hypothetical protein